MLRHTLTLLLGFSCAVSARSWERTADPVDPATAKAVRAGTKDRTDAWRQDELQQTR